MTATQAYVYDLVGPATATSGIALANLVSQIASSAGAIVGGVVIAQSDMGVAFVLVALAWLVAAGLLGFASPPARTELVKPETSPRRALTLLMRDRAVAAIALLIILTEIFGFSTAALVPTFAKDILRVDAAGLGVLLGARSIGGILGLGWLATRGARRRGGRLFLAATGAFGIVLVAFALSASFPLSLVLMLGTGMTAAALDTLGQTLLQRTSPDHERGAAMGVGCSASASGRSACWCSARLPRRSEPRAPKCSAAPSSWSSRCCSPRRPPAAIGLTQGRSGHRL